MACPMELANLYTALGVSVSAGEADIRSAYRRRALATHPDKGGSAEAFRLVVKAFETLADPGRREAHDRELERATSAPESKTEAPGHAPQPNKRCRQQGPKESKASEVKPKRRCEAPTGDQTGSPPPEGIPKLAKELLGLSLTVIRSRLKKLVLEVLRELLTFLETTGLQAAPEFGEDEEENYASASEDDPENVLPLCDDECPDLIFEADLQSEPKLQPDCIVLASLPGVPQLNTCLCAQLQLKDGSLCQGPLRASLVLAKRDMKELSAIREAKGDDAVKEEASRRDADVMTSFFMTGRLA
ncbi:DNAJ1 [Symbiodinium necroappetens]|uniref:DNAJ1 protein n=1 Tax=Symbiodinium necroappetens TaxID=1628268 RepID=A0A812PJ72_9DINO|nr:DNAJ1 [Symbiodinium necroappetens]